MRPRITREGLRKKFPKARAVGSQTWVDARGDFDTAKAMLPQRLEDAGFGSVWVMIFVEVLLVLFKWWLLNKITDPGMTPLPGEPGAADMEVPV